MNASIAHNIICTVDVVLLCLKDAGLHVALLRRDHEPYEGVFALPGGFVSPELDQNTEDAAMRILREKAGIESPYLEQLATFSGQARDPRGWSVSIAYYALVPLDLLDLEARPDISLAPVDVPRALPFDHKEIISSAAERVRSKSTYSSLPVYLCGDRFTLPHLQSVYEALLGEPLNKVSFRRKMDELNILEPIPGQMETGRANRPAQYYRLKSGCRNRLSLSNRGLSAG